MKLFTCLVMLAGFVLFAGCKKKTINPTSNVPDAAVIGNWKLVKVDGEIDSSITINSVKTTTKMTLSFDSVSNQYTHLLNNQVVYQYPYSLIITFNKTGSDQLMESYTRPNGAGASTPYFFVTNSFWNYTTSVRVDDGLVIKGFEKTSALGYYKINPSTTLGSNTIQSILTVPYFTSYDYRQGHLFLYVTLQFIGNADNQGGGVVTNPGTQINMNYTLMFSKTGSVINYN
ncbi:MAG TPA: hypothetical protein VNW51_09895 [Mucilaginibacter sp.]|jgi:hypothetical protein|nr:hypothetical protein [Mucilaginibacter sp.]